MTFLKDQINAVDVVVVGGGHAGIEAAAASARLGCKTILVSHNQEKIGELSCNPAIGGIGKGQLVKEVDALGGLMGETADKACIHYRQLNQSRGAAVRSSRMQVDMDVYRKAIQDKLRGIQGLTILEDEVIDVIITGGSVTGIYCEIHGMIAVRAVVITAGTFFNGLMHIGQQQIKGGRINDKTSEKLPEKLRQLKLSFGRFKTGTTPRLDGATIDFSKFTEQPGDEHYISFSNRSPNKPLLKQVSCYIGNTNILTHKIIRENLGASALYSGQITGTGVRYCPSVEDKIVKFPKRESHHVFIEPEGLSTTRYYSNGLSNSLPVAIQESMVHSVEGLENARIVQDGYGIEHDYLEPTQLKRTLETKAYNGLFFAGQINGTTGYEEAAAQGLIAGINAGLKITNKEPFILDRSQAYIGVLIDDLTTKGTNEPYRMFTSRVEYRLVIREDNADERLTKLGYQLGLITECEYEQYNTKMNLITNELKRLSEIRVAPSDETNALLEKNGFPIRQSITLLDLLKRSEVHYYELAQLNDDSKQVPDTIQEAVEVRVKYEGYIKRQQEEINKFKYLEQYQIPNDFLYEGLSGLSLEVVEKLSVIRPETLGQASRISGITPAAISLLMLYIKKR